MEEVKKERTNGKKDGRIEVRREVKPGEKETERD